LQYINRRHFNKSKLNKLINTCMWTSREKYEICSVMWLLNTSGLSLAFTPVSCLAYSSTLKMEETRSFETSVSFQRYYTALHPRRQNSSYPVSVGQFAPLSVSSVQSVHIYVGRMTYWQEAVSIKHRRLSAQQLTARVCWTCAYRGGHHEECYHLGCDEFPTQPAATRSSSACCNLRGLVCDHEDGGISSSVTSGNFCRTTRRQIAEDKQLYENIESKRTLPVVCSPVRYFYINTHIVTCRPVTR
jgi:hypothetical protein